MAEKTGNGHGLQVNGSIFGQVVTFLFSVVTKMLSECEQELKRGNCVKE